MRFRLLMVVLALTLFTLPALAQPIYLGSGYGNNLFYRSLGTSSDLWNWGSFPNGAYYDSPYGDWTPSILYDYYYPRNYYSTYYYPYYTSYPLGMYGTTYNPYLYSSQY